MLKSSLKTAFFLLFFLTPLVWVPYTSELFEFNKMMLVYLLTVIITSAWIIRMIAEKRLIFKKTPLDIPLLLFLLANILSTYFSLDRHLSVWGYYSRLNGGLLSTISYLLLYFALVSNFSKEEILNFLKVSLWSGFLVALYAIPEHFGSSPSCLLITSKFDDGCWIQKVQERVFATLGQPNWLAAYLEMLIFPAFYFLITTKKKWQILLYGLMIVAYTMAFTFTYSRGATLGLIAGGVLFALLIFVPKSVIMERRKLIAAVQLVILDLLAGIGWGYITDFQSRNYLGFLGKVGLLTGVLIIIELLIFQGKKLLSNFKTLTNKWALVAIVIIFAGINVYYGTSILNRFELASQTTAADNGASGSTQLETGGTESGEIRLIVWQGALDIFKHYPIVGAGVETFAQVYYQYRPQAHNLTTEWDFLYNKAHNEYLNYLSTTGAVGFTTYMLIIILFMGWSLQFTILNLEGEKADISRENALLTAAIACGYLANLIQNFFGFSVVITALLFFLMPAMAYSAGDAVSEVSFGKFVPGFNKLPKLLHRHQTSASILIGLISLIGIALVYTIYNFYRADIYYNAGYKYDLAGNSGQAYNYLTDAVDRNPYEPLYQSELGFAAASSAVALSDGDATLSGQLKEQAVDLTSTVLNEYPHNVSLYRTGIRTFYMLSNIDPSYTQKSLALLDKAIALAPTDPKLYYNKGVILSQDNQIDPAIAVLKQAIEEKPDYSDAHYALGLLYFQNKQKGPAINEMNTVLKIIPNQAEALEKLKEWQTSKSP